MHEATITDVAFQTPLTKYLLAQQARSQVGMNLTTYRGARTLERLDAASVENEALLFGAAVHDLGWLRRIAVRGDDRFRWLSGMVTNAVEGLVDGSGAYNLVLNAQGRIQGDCVVWRDGDSLELEVTAEQSEALLAHFDRFIIMDDVELVAIEKSAVGITGPGADEVLQQLGLPVLSEVFTIAAGSLEGVSVGIERGFGVVVPHYALWAEAESIPALFEAVLAVGAKPVGSAALETLRVVEGIPAYGADIQSRDLAQETSQVRALSFTKGCYLGQEIVERIRSRGQVHRHLRSIELMPKSEGWIGLPAVGIEMKVVGAAADAKSTAVVTSLAELEQVGRQRRVFAIAMVRAEAEIGDPVLECEGFTGKILSSPAKV